MNKDRVTSRVNVTGTPGLRRLLQDEDIRASFDAQMLTRTVALEVKRIRKEIGITQSELAKRANTTQPEIAKIEKGESPRGPTLLTIERVSKALDRKFALKVVTIRKGSNKHVRRFKRRKRRDFQYLGAKYEKDPVHGFNYRRISKPHKLEPTSEIMSSIRSSKPKEQ